VEKAQRLLMERNGMERREAYRYIQKQSMNSGNSMLEVAGTILKSDYY
jgi:response regulator NasT